MLSSFRTPGRDFRFVTLNNKKLCESPVLSGVLVLLSVVARDAPITFFCVDRTSCRSHAKRTREGTISQYPPFDRDRGRLRPPHGIVVVFVKCVAEDDSGRRGTRGGGVVLPEIFEHEYSRGRTTLCGASSTGVCFARRQATNSSG